MLFQNKFLYTGCYFSQSQNLKSAMEGYFVGLGAELEGNASQPPKAGGLGKTPPVAGAKVVRDFAIFYKNILILGLF